MIFSHEVLRPGQKEFVDAVSDAVQNKGSLLVHAPTGLGKTAAVLCPAIEHALKHDLFVFFLTSRHTQHKIVLETLEMLRQKNKVNLPCASVIGKKWMCAQENVQTMLSSDFTEYCKNLVKSDSCHFYLNTRGKNNVEARSLVKELSASTVSAEDIISRSVDREVCPYEISLMLAGKAKVIIADYYYAFNPHIRNAFFNKIKKRLEQAIIVVDEAHNLPARARNLLTSRLTNRVIDLAIKEARKNHLEDALPVLEELRFLFDKARKDLSSAEERLVDRGFILKSFTKFKPLDELLAELNLSAEAVLMSQKRSFIGSVAGFLERWVDDQKSFIRILARNDDFVSLSNIGLDPAVLTGDVFSSCHSSVLMSGTLNPVEMYRDLLGFDEVESKVFPSPFPEKNRLALIVPRTTTKYNARSDAQFENIASTVAEIANSIPGCVMIFFPSYFVRDRIAQRFVELYDKTAFFETAGMSKQEKQDFLDRFKAYKERGAALLGVTSGSFGEGVDLPGLLKGVIVVGLPLDRPNLETKELISYYDEKFGKGWDYGYTLPAMARTIQNAGRCIRSERDKGVLCFVDERYAWARYGKSFPPDWNAKVTLRYKEEINAFFS